LFIALALAIRTNEVVWVLAILLFLSIVYFSKIKWQYGLLFGLTCLVVFMPIFYYNQVTYGNYLSFGYLRIDQGSDFVSQLPTEFKTGTNPVLNFFLSILLPFGFHPKTALINFYNYFISLFWWFFAAALLGIFSYIKRYQAKEKAVYLFIFLLVSLYLVIYYGSWVFNDLMTLQLNKIGISYVRYFLPIFIGCLPMVTLFFLDLVSFFKSKAKIYISLLLFFVFLGFSINIIFLSKNDGLISIKQNIAAYNQINKKVAALTESNAVIISERSDKIFWPERKVIVYANNPDDMASWSNLIYAGVPIYFYAYEGETYLGQLDYDLGSFDLALSEPQAITPTENLYKIIYSPYYD